PIHMIREMFKRHRSAFKHLRQFDCPLECPIRHEDRRHAIALEMLRGKLSHLACADDHDRLACQISEYLPGQFDRRITDRYGGLRYPGFTANFLRYGKRAIHQGTQVHSDGAGIGRNAIRFLHLAENLWLSDHHRIETGRDAKDMPDGVDIPEAVQMFRNRVLRDLMKFAEELADQPV